MKTSSDICVFCGMSEIRAKDLVRQVINELGNLYDEGEAKAIALHYLQDRFHADRMKVALNTPIHTDDRLLKHDMELLKIGTPLQHVVGFAQFFGHRFKCNPNALIPRPETEELVNWVINEVESLAKKNTTQLKVLDIGTGTGCIPISIALAKPALKVYGYDVSEEALSLAKENSHALGAKVTFKRHDILAEDIQNNFDVVISNPPYIPWREKEDMHINVVANDPELALFVPDEDPLLFYRGIGEKSKESLNRNGLVFFEIHEQYGQKVIEILSEIGYTNIELKQDINGKDRMIKAQL